MKTTTALRGLTLGFFRYQKDFVSVRETSAAVLANMIGRPAFNQSLSGCALTGEIVQEGDVFLLQYQYGAEERHIHKLLGWAELPARYGEGTSTYCLFEEGRWAGSYISRWMLAGMGKGLEQELKKTLPEITLKPRWVLEEAKRTNDDLPSAQEGFRWEAIGGGQQVENGIELDQDHYERLNAEEVMFQRAVRGLSLWDQPKEEGVHYLQVGATLDVVTHSAPYIREGYRWVQVPVTDLVEVVFTKTLSILPDALAELQKVCFSASDALFADTSKTFGDLCEAAENNGEWEYFDGDYTITETRIDYETCSGIKFFIDTAAPGGVQVGVYSQRYRSIYNNAVRQGWDM